MFLILLKPITASAKVVEGQALNSYLDKITKENFQKYRLPSLCMVVVKDGKIIYENALGYADVKNKIKADVNSSVYRIGSTSKIFTETAIMQLYEQGKIDLKEDANKYLGDIKIQNKFAKKVTVENLLTHTSGIDEATFPYTAVKTQSDMISLSSFLRKHQPVVTTEPGKVCLYSNIGIDLLGHIIESVSGMKYEAYVQKNIFNVLNMNNSKVSLPLNGMTKNYDSLVETGYVYYNDSPAGGINSTPLDIAKFMMAHLQKGVYKNNKILKESTVKLMQEHHFSNDKNLCGIGYGFWEKNFNGKRILSHEGALSVGYFDDMLLDTEENLGVYIVSNNLTSAAPAITDIENAFFNKYYSDKKLKVIAVIQ
ncbi:serine hydrolase domain-containing protein [Clostridium sp. DMHC 10]|uniref:serine hydrolase domain-containing protein n=1 Tax=Clostridium sp. DMHC 10 TaxID=747377 RepID=UPI000B296793|nr:serine hydrolase domain-containing protein [Clostridium sp. DMHC 10]